MQNPSNCAISAMYFSFLSGAESHTEALKLCKNFHTTRCLNPLVICFTGSELTPPTKSLKDDGYSRKGEGFSEL